MINNFIILLIIFCFYYIYIRKQNSEEFKIDNEEKSNNIKNNLENKKKEKRVKFNLKNNEYKTIDEIDKDIEEVFENFDINEKLNENKEKNEIKPKENKILNQVSFLANEQKLDNNPIQKEIELRKNNDYDNCNNINDELLIDIHDNSEEDLDISILNNENNKLEEKLNLIQKNNKDENIIINKEIMDKEENMNNNKYEKKNKINNKIISDYSLKNFYKQKHPVQFFDIDHKNYINNLERKKETKNVVIDRINNFKNNNKDFTSEKIMDTYDSLVRNQYVATDKVLKNKRNNFNEGANNNKILKDDIWNYKKESELNGGKIQGEIYGNDLNTSNNAYIGQ
jgi:hypothetical protein